MRRIHRQGCPFLRHQFQVFQLKSLKSAGREHGCLFPEQVSSLFLSEQEDPIESLSQRHHLLDQNYFSVRFLAKTKQLDRLQVLNNIITFNTITKQYNIIIFLFSIQSDIPQNVYKYGTNG